MNERQKAIYTLLCKMFQMTGVSPDEAVPIMRRLCNDVEEIINARQKNFENEILSPAPSTVQ